MSFFGSMPNSSSEGKDILVQDAPTDSISSMSWSPTQNMIACGSWSKEVRVWQIDSNSGQTKAIGLAKHDSPILSIHWNGDGTNIYSGCCDKTLTLWNPNLQKPIIIGKHDAPIKCISLSSNSSNGEHLITGSWDRKIKYWDTRSHLQEINGDTSKLLLKPITTIELPERVYAMDLHRFMLCIALANKKILIYDIRKPNQLFKEVETSLKQQLRAISCFNDCNGFIAGSIEGRCVVQYLSESNNNNNTNNKKKKGTFSFKCHRENETGNVYTINQIEFHRKYGTFLTGGSDGVIHCWDKDNRSRLHSFNEIQKQCGLPTINFKEKLAITDLKYNKDYSLLAYSLSYDWTKGIQFYNPNCNEMKPRLFIHKMKEEECKPNN